MSPLNRLDAFFDHDGDGLQAVQEFRRGTSPLNPDTDGDGASDSLEVALGTDPLNAASKPSSVIVSLSVVPNVTKLSITPVLPQITKQLKVLATLQDGTVIDVTTRGTSYTSSNTSKVTVNSQGLISAVSAGTANITARNSTLTAVCSVAVEQFSPTPVRSIPVTSGTVSDVDAEGDRLFVAARSGGVHVVDITVPDNAAVLNSVPMEDARRLKVRGNYVYVANGTGNAKSIETTTFFVTEYPGTTGAEDIAVNSKYVFLACASAGLKIIDRTTGVVYLPFSNQSPVPNVLSVDADERYAVLQIRSAANVDSIAVYDVSSASLIFPLGSLVIQGTVTDVLVSGVLAFVGTSRDGIRIVSFSNPSQPALLSTAIIPGQSIPGGLVATDLAIWGNFLFSGDMFYVNAVPFFNVQNASTPIWNGLINFTTYGDADTVGVDVERNYVYAAATDANTNIVEIAKFITFTDNGTSPPQVEVALPVYGESKDEGTTFDITATASDDVAVASVTFFVDNVQKATDNAPPFITSYRLPYVTSDTPVSLRAEAVDYAGNRGISETVQITNRAILDTVPPVVDLIKPVAGTALLPGQVIVLEATASDDRAVRVSFYANDQQVGQTFETPPYKVNWTVPNSSPGQTFVIKAVAIDPGENTVEDSVTLSGVSGSVAPSFIAANDFSFDNTNLFVSTGSVVTIDGAHQFLDVYIYKNTTLTHTGATATTESLMDLQVSKLIIETGSKIDTTSKGYLGGRQGNNTATSGRTIGNIPGSNCVNVTTVCGGGSHGGEGGKPAGANPVYGGVTQPLSNGSGGAATSTSRGGNGGGVVKIRASVLMTIDGSILANGGPALFATAGGGSGGSVWLQAPSITGAGVIEAKGGVNISANAGTGGGGRIAIYCPSLTIPTANIRASSVAAISGGSAGGAGTIYIER